MEIRWLCFWHIVNRSLYVFVLWVVCSEFACRVIVYIVMVVLVL